MTSAIVKHKIELNQYKNVTWKTQDSDKNSILFYSLSNTEKSKEQFKERILNSNYNLCIVNGLVDLDDKKIICVPNDDWLQLQKEVCDYFYPIKSKFQSICVTGTNGKTTTVDLIRQLCVNNKINVLTIGTLGVWLNSSLVSDFGLTSPAYIDFRKYVYLHQKSFDVLAVEMSSHALVQERFFGFTFDLGLWTSFSQDHLDYHKTLDEYFNAKLKIYEKVRGGILVPHSEKFVKKLPTNKTHKVEIQNFDDNLFLKARYNKINMTLAVEALKRLNFKLKNKNFDFIKSPPGRFNIIDHGESFIVIDFAHTPDALENICREIKASFSDYNLVTLFGCGGDRDKSKRPMMAKAAEENSDFIIITSDNPRFEKPQSIIKDIVKGVKSNRFKIIEERSEAIKYGFGLLKKTVFLIAGKGHEEYIDQNGEKRYYSDLEEVKRNMAHAKN